MADVGIYESRDGSEGLWVDVQRCDRARDIRNAVLADRTELMRLSRAEYEWPPRRIKSREIGASWGWIFWAALAKPRENVILLAVACSLAEFGDGLDRAKYRLAEHLRTRTPT